MKLLFKLNLYLLLIVSIITLFLSLTVAHSQVLDDNKQPSEKDIRIYPDEFSVLDGTSAPNTSKDKYVIETLEKSRQRYLQALILLNRKDTVNAVKFFEGAINILNQLVSYPGIDKNPEFIDLAQSIIEDYESKITSIENLDENSSLFIFRDKIFQEIDISSAKPPVKIETIDLSKVSSTDSVSTELETIIPLDDNEFVEKSLDFLTKNRVGRKFVQNCIERLGKWGSLIYEIIEEEGMPREIIHLSMIESALNPMAVSRAAAVGLWQFIRSTGKLYGLNANDSPWIDERKDPYKSTRASLRHLKDLYNELGDWHLAFAAYNYGVGGVKRSIKKSKLENPNFWELRPFLPKETRNYVPLFIATTRVMSNPAKYGFDVSEFNIQEEYEYDTYTLTEPISLTALAKCSGITVDELRALNPELVSSSTPPDVKQYELRIPVGSMTTFLANLATLTPEEKQPWFTHKVGKKETIASIAKKYNVSVEELASANNLSPADKKYIKKGTNLLIPIQIPDKDSLKEEAQASVADVGNSNPVSDRASEVKYSTYTAQQGETIYSIANKFNVRIADLRIINNISYNVEEIEPGTVLKIAPINITKNEQETSTKTSLVTKQIVVQHNVKAGETLAQLAEGYNVSVADIRIWNRMSGNIQPGQNLKIITTQYSKDEFDKLSATREVRTKTANVNSAPLQNQQKSNVSRRTHKVQKGENLSQIAAKYNVSESDLKLWNPKLIKGDKIFSGTTIRLYPTKEVKTQATATTKTTKSKSYTVRRGDTLQKIAKKFGVTVNSIQKKNKNISNQNLKAGQVLKIN